MRISPARTLTEFDVVFDQQVIPARVIPFDSNPDPVLIAGLSLRSPPLFDDSGFG